MKKITRFFQIAKIVISRILWLSYLEYQNFNILKNTNYNFYFQNFKIVIFFFQKLGSEEPNSGLHRLVPTLDNVHLHLDKVQSLN